MHSRLTGSSEPVLGSGSLGQKIELIIQRLPPKEVDIIAILDLVGNDSLLLLTIFLALVFLVPVSIPGVSTVFGTAILLIGITRLLNRKPWLPKSIASRQLPTDRLRSGLERALAWFRRLEKISRPHRLSLLTSAGGVALVNHLAFIFAALLLMVPLGLVPFSNTFPALALIFLAVGMLQRDGGFILLGYLANVVTVIYFALLIVAGGEGIQALVNFLR